MAASKSLAMRLLGIERGREYARLLYHDGYAGRREEFCVAVYAVEIELRPPALKEDLRKFELLLAFLQGRAEGIAHEYEKRIAERRRKSATFTSSN